MIILLAVILRLNCIPQDDPPDFYADTYVAKVILNDPFDMYTKEKLNQTSQEQNKWTKEKSSPYPPLALFLLTGLYIIGEVTGAGFWITAISIEFLLVILIGILCYKSKYDKMYPFLVLNPFIVWRVWHMADTTYLLMVSLVTIAFFTCLKNKNSITAFLMACAVSIKFVPVYIYRAIFKLHPKSRWLLVVIPAVFLILPYFIFDNYLYIYTFHSGRNILPFFLQVVVMGIFFLELIYMERKLEFELIDILGYSLLPLSLFTTMKIGYWKYIIWALIIPDRRYYRILFGAGLTALWMMPLRLSRIEFALLTSLAVLLLCPTVIYLETRQKAKIIAISKKINDCWCRIIKL